MKTAHFFFRIVSFGALMIQVGFAAEPSRQLPEKLPHLTRSTVARSVAPVHPGQEQPKLNSPKSSSPGPLHLQPERAVGNESHQPGAKKPDPVPHSGLMLNKVEIHHEQPARLPGGSATTAPLTSVDRNRSATPAVAGGSTMAAPKTSTAALNGAAMKARR
jgi:hypothetical protein